ncbi:winged helix-turn-helix domain-containing protein [Steroidobacter sp. S1-65]|uniref:Winged helix-turn-helix domain-containing protein n=1 Tax=Steroidobacter gossypii TaxID=2805490 RepID=A0ABS1X2D1_9GAMM|nr:response regulator [Steroidobacter gossypii]MBM0107386.1 winged helix-turn-helix domain-containing protein [Steroidobacter gossypii]
MSASAARLTPEPTRILLIEDDVQLASLIVDYLREHEFQAHVEHRGDTGLERILRDAPDLVVLDVLLPGLNGMEVCRHVRGRYAGPILMLTARDDEVDEIISLELGADDYVTKPVEPRLLLARIRALLRRAGHSSVTLGTEPRCLSFGAFSIDQAARRVTLSGESIDLTTGEFDLLWLLASAAGAVLSRDVILASLRGIDYDGLDRSIDIGISRLRAKLRDTTTPPTRIKTVRGKGYLFVPDAW